MQPIARKLPIAKSVIWLQYIEVEKICKNCAQEFTITEADTAFYEKLQVPPATLCPDCRQQRRLAWRNERYMYKRKCDFSGKDIVSMYPPDTPFKIYEQEVWWSDKWDPLTYGRPYDFNRPFFEQFRELQLEVPRVALVNKQSENSAYTNHAGKNRNCFMSAVTFGCEDIYYSDWIIDHCRDCVDCSYLFEGCELCYETYYAWASYKAIYCDFIKNCSDVWFCYDCFGTKNSFLCWNLRNKQYCIRNKQYTKEGYEAEMRKIFPLSYEKLKELRQEYIDAKKTKAVHAPTYRVQAENSSGDLLFNTKNCFHSYDCIKTEDARYIYDSIELRDSMDLYHAGLPGDLMYECHAISNGYNLKFCHFCYDNVNLTYCDCCQNSKNLFGCVSLKHNEYCILNKQYTKGEYEELVPKIIEHMGGPLASAQREVELKNEYGEFFPMQFAPFAYNQSRAQEYYPLTKKETESQGIRWSDYEAPLPAVKKTLQDGEIPTNIEDIKNDILDAAIVCEISGKPFKIIKEELRFYRTVGLPVPRCHPNQRYLDRMAQRNPRRLWQRTCQKCGVSIETSYSPDGPEIVYCEKCYLEAVY